MAKRSEDELDETFDRCLADTTLKTLGACTIGALTAALIKRPFPFWLALGMGIGMGIANCRHDMSRPFKQRKCRLTDSKSDLTVIEEHPGGAPQTQ